MSSAGIPIIFLSATYVSAEDERFALGLGAMRFLPKPVEADELFIAVADALTGQSHTVPPMSERQFYTGYRQTVRHPNELIVAFEVPRVRGRQWFRKVGTRAAQAISKVVVAGVVNPGQTRIAHGSVAPTVVRAWLTEAALARGASIEEAQRTLSDEIAPIDDVRSTAEYRRRVAANLLARMLTGR